MKLRWGVMIALIALIWVPVAGGAADPKSGPAHITTTHRFLMAWSHEQWDELRAVSADSVAIKIGDKTFALDPVNRKSDVALVPPFRGLSTARSGMDVKGVTVGELHVRAGGQDTQGAAMIALEEKAGEFRVVSVSLDAQR
ncbi:MAG TPA: hypothetical protein VGL09_08240 [Methylomirabilota bacterium]|jgi:hypothetical protein